ncbi:MAG: ribosome-associated translation inhibitor RaiA [Chitinophagales bacterium]|nr:ribosome-associated translation inhibitor RaiA [Chitinophagales bacterium]
MKLQIQSVHFDADQKLKDFINKKLSKLDLYYDKVIGSDVILTFEGLNTQVRDKVVTIKTQIPGTVLIAKEKSKKFEESIDLAVESLRRQIEKIKTKAKK